MKRVWVWAVLAALPLAAAAQQTPAPRPFKDDAFPPAAPAEAGNRSDQDSHVMQMPPPKPGEGQGPRDMSDDDTDDDTTTDSQAPAAPRGQAPAEQPGQPSQGQAQRGGWIPMGTAMIQALDKINARAETLTIKVGQAGHFGSLDIGIRGCLVRPNDRPADATAFLVVRDRANPDTPVFNAWMVRSAPFLSMMAHPLYDLRVTGCAP